MKTKSQIEVLKRDIEKLEQIIADQMAVIKLQREKIEILEKRLQTRGLSKEILGHLTTY